MKSLPVLLLTAAYAVAAVDGVVVNQTTNKPQAGVTVALIQLGEGMKSVGSVQSGPDGKFNFDLNTQPGAPYLIQAMHQGVNYNRMLPPGTPGTGLTIQVYEASAKTTKAVVTQDMFLVEPNGSEVLVSERVVYTNDGNITYADPEGTLRFFVPEGVSRPVQVRVQGPQGMPINRPAEKGSQPNTYVVKYPIKPGETNIDINYALPMSGNEAKFAGKILHSGGPIRFVTPSGVKIEGPFADAGPIPGTAATAYTLTARQFDLKITGTGSLRAAAQPEAAGEPEEGSQIEARKPLIYDKLTYVLVFAFSMLAVGFVILYRRVTPVRAGAKR